MYQRHVTDIRSRIFNSIVEVIIVQVHKWASADKTIQYWLESPLSKISTRIKGYSSCSMISWPFKRDKGLPSGTVLLQSSLTRKSIPDRRNSLEYYMKPFKQSIQGKKKTLSMSNLDEKCMKYCVYLPNIQNFGIWSTFSLSVSIKTSPFPGLKFNKPFIIKRFWPVHWASGTIELIDIPSDQIQRK